MTLENDDEKHLDFKHILSLTDDEKIVLQKANITIFRQMIRNRKAITLFAANNQKYIKERRSVVAVQDDNCCVFGASIFIYRPQEGRTGTPTVVHIEKVDTTGQFAPRNLQSQITCRIMKAFVMECFDSIKGPWRLHLTACAKPSLIFPLSHKNEEKRPIVSHQLGRWWLNLLCDTFTSEKIWIGYCTIGIERSLGLDTRIKSRCSSRLTRADFGMDNNQNCAAADLLPIFEDDILSTIVKNTAKDKIKFEEVLALAQINHDVDLVKGITMILCKGENDATGDSIVSSDATSEDGEDMLKELQRGDFGSVDASRKSTDKFLRFAKGNSKIKELSVEISLYDLGRDLKRKPCDDAQLKSLQIKRSAPVQILNAGLIKRK